jgi:hypothetical protein
LLPTALWVITSITDGRGPLACSRKKSSNMGVEVDIDQPETVAAAIGPLEAVPGAPQEVPAAGTLPRSRAGAG